MRDPDTDARSGVGLPRRRVRGERPLAHLDALLDLAEEPGRERKAVERLRRLLRAQDDPERRPRLFPRARSERPPSVLERICRVGGHPCA